MHKPLKTKILFVSEAPSITGTFYYNETSDLYRYTKDSFELATKRRFSIEYFRDSGCWLYYVYEKPISSYPKHQRKLIIRENIPKVIKMIKELTPMCVIVVRKSEFKKEIKSAINGLGYEENMNIFYLPFPAYGRQSEYKNILSTILRSQLTLH